MKAGTRRCIGIEGEAEEKRETNDGGNKLEQPKTNRKHVYFVTPAPLQMQIDRLKRKEERTAEYRLRRAHREYGYTQRPPHLRFGDITEKQVNSKRRKQRRLINDNKRRIVNRPLINKSLGCLVVEWLALWAVMQLRDGGSDLAQTEISLEIFASPAPPTCIFSKLCYTSTMTVHGR